MPYLGRPVTNAGQFEIIDDISSGFNGSETSFTLQVGGTDIQPDAANVTIVLDGVVQIPSSAYSVTGSTLNFTEAPTSGTEFHGVLAGQSQFIESDFITNTMIKSTANISGSKINTDFSAQTVKAAIFDGMISGSAQLADDISGSFSKEHLGAKVANVVTSSAQLADDISGSLSNTAIGNLEAGIISGSSQLATDISGSFGNQRVGTSDSPTFAGGTITGDFAVGGTLTAQEVHTEFESASILFTSGSTQFGNSSDDVHEFKGNTISGSSTSTGSFGSIVVQGNVDFNANLDVDGTTNLDNTDIDGTLTVDGGNIVFNEDSADQDFRVESNGNANMLFVDGGQNAVGIGTNNAGASGEKLLIVGNDNQNFLVVSSSNDDNFISIGTFENDQAIIGFGNKATTPTALNFYAANRPPIGGSNLVMSLSGSGNVGIGTAQPDAKLKVEESTNGANVEIKMRALTDGGGGRTFSFTADPDARTLAMGESGELVIKEGKVGIGTDSPSAPLHVSGANDTTFASSAGGSPANLFLQGSNSYDSGYSGGGIFFLGEYQSGANTAFAAVSGIKENTTSGQYGGAVTFFTRTNGSGAGAAERMRISSTGKVGIGTDNPGHTLVVKGASGTSPMINVINSDTEDNDTGRESTIRFSGFRSGGEAVDNGQITGTHDGSADDDKGMLTFFTNGGSGQTEKMRIDSSGNVGIGTDNPGYKLEVADANQPQIAVTDTTNTVTTMLRAIDSVGYVGTQTNHPLWLVTNGTLRASLDTSGNVEVTNGNLIIGTSGKGIDFSATSNATGMSSELLDDYEEGVYDITIGGLGGGSVTMSSVKQQFSYTKIGRQVTVQGEISITAVSSLSGTMTINLPFSVGSSIGDLSSRAIGSFSSQNHDFNDLAKTIHAQTYEGQSVMRFVYHKDNAGWEYVNTNTLASNTEFRVSLTYFTN